MTTYLHFAYNVDLGSLVVIWVNVQGQGLTGEHIAARVTDVEGENLRH